ncbi:hypothetical protein DIURU_004300 [Diutina rugosa]|uniref:Uncharacterized protein n=1 Tax=Diutina rugosa TaxID=5481 RepID=A0A642UPU4_DIURU|nr:uncharacterized protein DIURU_004300 [Diutina rugosa]KAA8899458.1 hypothetical protein DIURU_004300 [Diutina rugosa]
MRQLFTKSQMAQLVCLNAPGYHILDFDPLVNLQELHMTTDEDITSTFPFPSSVVYLKVHTYRQVVGIFPHVKVLKITGESSRVKIRSSTLRELEASAKGVVVDCPQLTRLTLSGVWRNLYLNTPNVVFLELNGFRYNYKKLLLEEKFPLLAHLSLNDYRAQDELYIPQPLKSAKLSLLELKSRTLTADDVSIWCCKPSTPKASRPINPIQHPCCNSIVMI